MNNNINKSPINTVNTKKFILPDGLSPRAQWIWNNRLPAMIDCLLVRERLEISPLKVFEQLCQADPSTNKSAVQWMIECYLREGFLWEDCAGGQQGKIGETLLWFSTYRKNLDDSKRNIYGYKTLADLYLAIEHCLKIGQETDDLNLPASEREIKRREKIKIYKQNQFLIDDNQCKVITPLTQESAQWWGQGTRWCTSARNHNYFDSYNKQAPLIIIMFKDKKEKSHKLQLWVTKDRFQFTDETDSSVNHKFVQNNWQSFKEILFLSAQKNLSILKYFPADELTSNLKIQQLYWDAVKTNGLNLCYVPETLRNDKICTLAIEQDALSLKFVPKSVVTAEICLKAVQQKSCAIEFVPQEFLTEQLGLIAIKNNGLLLNVIPEHLITENLCWAALHQKYQALACIPESILTEQMCSYAIGRAGSAIKNVPDRFKINSICVQAIKLNATSIVYIPENILTEQMCELAIEQDSFLIDHVPEKFKTDKLIELSKQSNPVKNKIGNR